MFRDSFDAIRSMLVTTFPDVTRTYVNKVPQGFTRPSFFVQLVSGSDDDLNKAMFNSTATWQIVYFAPIDASGDADHLNQLEVSDTLKGKLMEGMTLTGPSGVVYHILDCSGEPREGEVYIILRLETDKRRPEPQFDIMGDIQHNYNLK